MLLRPLLIFLDTFILPKICMDVALVTLPILPPLFFWQENHWVGIRNRQFLCRKTMESGLDFSDICAGRPRNRDWRSVIFSCSTLPIFSCKKPSIDQKLCQTVNRPEIVPEGHRIHIGNHQGHLFLEGPEDHLPKIVQQRDLDWNWAGHRLETEFIWTLIRNRPDFVQNESFKVANQEQRHLGWTMAWKKEAKERRGVLEPWTSSWYGADWQTLNFWIPVPKKSPFLPRILPNLSAVALVNATA